MEQIEYFEKNIEALKKHNEPLYKAVSCCKSIKVEYLPEKTAAKDGIDITKITKDDKIWYLNSQYRPLQEAVTFVEQYDKVIDYSVMIFFGFGNGIIPRQLRQSMGEHTVLFFFEPSAEIFFHTIHHYDVSDLFSADNTYVAVEKLNDELTDKFLEIYVKEENYKLIIYDVLPKYRKLFPEKAQWLEDKYRDSVTNLMANIKTKQELGKNMAINSIRNMKFLRNCHYRDEFKEIFPTDIPAVIVAAGPSLEKNIQVLKKMKGKALIIAVDAVLPYLNEVGFRPDLAITVDAEKPVTLFEDGDIRNLPLVMDASANYQIAELLSEQTLIFCGGLHFYYKKIFDIVGQKFEFMENGGCVATTAFALLRKWEFQHIILVGQDLAMEVGKAHAGNVDDTIPRPHRDMIPVEGYYGDTVYTPWDYNKYRKWYEKMLEEEDCPEVVNATEGGAKIKGAKQMSLQEVLDTYCTRDFDFERAIREMPPLFTEEDMLAVEGLWKESVRNLDKLKRNFKEGIRLVEEEIRLISRKSYTKKEIINIQKRLDKIFKECDSFEEIELVDYAISTGAEEVLGDLYEMEESDDDEHCRLLDKLKNYLSSMEEATREVKELFQELL